MADQNNTDLNPLAKSLNARLETAARRLEEASAVGVSDTVNGDDVGLVEARGVVGACRVAGVVIDVESRQSGKNFRFGSPSSPNGDVEQLPEALGMDVLELAIRGVVQRQPQLASEAPLKRQPAVNDLGVRQIEVLVRELGGAVGPSALHLDATEALLGGCEERLAVVVDDDNARFVTAVISDQHLATRQRSDSVAA